MDSDTESIRGENEYIKQIQSDLEIKNTIDEIDVNLYVLTTYQVNDYVLREYPPSVEEARKTTDHGGTIPSLTGVTTLGQGPNG